MDKENFILDRIDRSNGHEDYWYKTDKVADEYLTKKYMEQAMIGVPRVVYSKDEDVVGVERLFPFNYDVIFSDDEQLKTALIELSQSKSFV